MEGYSHKPSNASSHQKLEEARSKLSPNAPWGSIVLQTPRFQPGETAFGLQASSTMKDYIFVDLGLQVCAEFVTEAIRIWWVSQ